VQHLFSDDEAKYGHLTVICGPMFSGKTGFLVERIASDTSTKVILKPAMDIRFSEDEIISRAGSRFAAQSISAWPSESFKGTDTIYIDEVQFLEPPYFEGDLADCVVMALQAGIDVVASGLDMDFEGRPFAITAHLAAMADTIVKLTARCTTCGDVAGKSLRFGTSAGRIQLGDAGEYAAACNRCFGSHRRQLTDQVR
jgi:thymidine kinase